MSGIVCKTRTTKNARKQTFTDDYLLDAYKALSSGHQWQEDTAEINVEAKHGVYDAAYYPQRNLVLALLDRGHFEKGELRINVDVSDAENPEGWIYVK